MFAVLYILKMLFTVNLNQNNCFKIVSSASQILKSFKLSTDVSRTIYKNVYGRFLRGNSVTRCSWCSRGHGIT